MNKQDQQNSCKLDSFEEKLASLIITVETGTAYHKAIAWNKLIRFAKQVRKIPDPVITVKKSELKSFQDGK